MGKSPAWKRFEEDVAALLGLSPTIASGSKHYDPGDGVHRGLSHAFPLYADAKYTEHIAFALKSFELRQYVERAAEMGKRFIMPIRFGSKAVGHHEDYVVLSLHDFKELLDGHRIQ